MRTSSVVFLMSQPSDGLEGMECECFGLGVEAGGLLACSRCEGRFSEFSKGEGRPPSGSECAEDSSGDKFSLVLMSSLRAG